MKIFAISGLGADERVFDFLTLEHELIHLPWIKPKSIENITDYSERLIDEYKLKQATDFGILGLSFGGLIAIEISKQINPKVTILISSIETRSDLGLTLRFASKLKLVNFIPKSWFKPPKRIAHFAFGAKNKPLLNAIINDTDLHFTKWAVGVLINWQNKTTLKNLIRIGGTNDLLLPQKGEKILFIDKGTHFMIVDDANQVSAILNRELRNYVRII